MKPCCNASHFDVWRLSGTAPFAVGAANARVFWCASRAAVIVEHAGADVAMEKGGVILLPAALGVCRFRPAGCVVLLELGVPEPA